MKNGKLPQQDEPVSLAEAFGSGTLDIDAGLAKEIADKKMGSKWVSEAKVKAHGGRHPSGWQIYKSKEFGGADQVVRHGDLILGVKPLTGPGSIEMHRRALADRIKTQDASNAANLRQLKVKGMEDSE